MIENNYNRPPLEKDSSQMNLTIKNFLIVIALALAFQFLSGFIVAILYGGNTDAFYKSSVGTLALSITTNIGYILSVFLVYGIKNSINDFFGVRGRNALKTGVIWGLLAIVINSAVSFLVNFWYVANDISPAKQNVVQILEGINGTTLMITIGLASFLIPIFEEILYRGVLQRTLQKRYSVKAGLILASLLFAVIHFDWYQLPGLFAIGMCFGISYNKSNSLLSPIIAHMINNVFAFCMLFLAK